MQRGSRARSRGFALQMSRTSADTTCRDARSRSQSEAGILRREPIRKEQKERREPGARQTSLQHEEMDETRLITSSDFSKNPRQKATFSIVQPAERSRTRF